MTPETAAAVPGATIRALPPIAFVATIAVPLRHGDDFRTRQQTWRRMTTDKTGAAGNSFVLKTLPWLIGAGGVLIYFITLNHWISFTSLGIVARISGWLWWPELERPLQTAVFFPFRCLPAAGLPLALNIFTAGGAGLVLVLLARSVALLRHDILPEGAINKSTRVTLLSTPKAWIPPVLAAVVCGLQRSFWEHATSATGEMISLLCFAYAFRCLLEFRVTREQFWLSRCACIYAAGMADNWMMVGYFPVVLAAIIWVKGLNRFLSPRFLLRMAGWGLVGLSAYLLLPTLLSLSPDDPLNFWMALKAHLKSQKSALLLLKSPEFRLLLLTGVVPFLILAVRWKSHTVQCADDTPLGVFIIKAAGHFIHSLFFVTSIWIALNPSLTPKNLDWSGPMLIYYYPWAVGAGYCAGYFLLFGQFAGRGHRTKPPGAAIFLLLVVLSGGLLWKNLGVIQTTNSPAIHEFARELYQDLPADTAVVLSEETQPLLLLRAELAAHGRDRKVIPVFTSALAMRPEYHEFMARQFPTQWPVWRPTNGVGTMGASNLVALVSELAAHKPLVYLHPGFGLFFEEFREEPHGSVYCLVPRPDGGVDASALTDAQVTANEQIWQQRWHHHLDALARQIAGHRQNAARWSRPELKWLRLANPTLTTASVLCAGYSRTLNDWGVQMQRHGRGPEAVKWFRRAMAINPYNLAAHINLEYANRSQRRDRSRLPLAGTIQRDTELFGKYDTWWEVLNSNGPVDEPTFLLQTGRTLLAFDDYRQATESFTRCVALAPDWLAPKLWLAHCYTRSRNFGGALKLTDNIQASNPPPNGSSLAQLLECRVRALGGLGRTNDAARCLERFVEEHGQHREVLSVAAAFYAAVGQFQPELALREELVRRESANLEYLARKGLAELRLKRYEPAIATLTQVITIEPTNEQMRFLRAVAFLGAGQLEAARSDYLPFLRKPPSPSPSVSLALESIDGRERETDAVMRYYQQFLSNSVVASLQAASAFECLQQLQE